MLQSMEVGHNRIRLRVRIDVGREPAIGPGKIALLEAIMHEGSLSAAARKLGMSYRRAWLLIEDINSRMRKPAVIGAKGGAQGGSSEVTASGRRLVELFRSVEGKISSRATADVRELNELLAK
jgi:molybdate transport system regulatory protein